MNGRIHGELKDPVDSPEAVILKRLSLLDGARRYSLCLWRLPEGVPFDRVDLAALPQEYIQAAGSKDRMTVEIRRFEDGVPRQYVVGHTIDDSQPPPRETVVPWDAYVATVFTNEVYTADEAANLFAVYYTVGDMTEGQNLRLLAL